MGELIGFLRSIRQPYLSTAPPPRRSHLANGHGQQQHFTDTQRDNIDSEAKSTLRDLHAAVKNLAQAESIRHNAAAALAQKRRQKRGFGALGQWAAGGGTEQLSPEDQAEVSGINTLKAHREGVIWFLQRKLETCGRIQSDMMETRISREIEKNKSVLYKTGGAGGPAPVWDEGNDFRSKATKQVGSVTLDELDDYASGGQELSQDQMQQFAEENRDMLKHYQDRLDQVRYVLCCETSGYIYRTLTKHAQDGGEVTSRNLRAAIHAGRESRDAAGGN